MTCLNERIVGALCVLMLGNTLSDYAHADGPTADLPETITVANIATVPMEVGSALPEPTAYLHRYEMQYQASQANQADPFFAQMENFYSAPLGKNERTFTGKPNGNSSKRDAAQASTANALHIGPSTAPQISIVQMPNQTLTLGAQPQRRLSLTVDDWVFSATARLAVLKSHDTGATLTVRKGF